MPAKDIYRDNVISALGKDGWAITDDPLKLKWRTRKMYVDIGAERLIAAEKGKQKIAVEVKSFLSKSSLKDLEDALGQYILYHDVLQEIEPERILYLAIRKYVYDELFRDEVGSLLLKNKRLRLIVFDANAEEIMQWIP
jgi:hypothetical protein